MKPMFYKKRKGRMLTGVCAGIADKYGWDLPLTRVIVALMMYFTQFGVIFYIILAIVLPFKEDIRQQNYEYRTGPRRRKDAEVVDDSDDRDSDGWSW